MQQKICFFNSCKTWGGGEKWHLENALFLKQQGFSVVMGVYKNSQLHKKAKEAELQCFTHRLSNLSFLNPLAYFYIQSNLEMHKVSHIIMAVPSDVKVAGIAANKARVPVRAYRRGSAIPIKNKPFNTFLFQNIITHVIANSKATRQTILQNNQNLFPKDKIAVIYNGFDIANYQEPYSRKEDRNHIKIKTLGRLEPQKNHVALLEVAQILKNSNQNFTIEIGGDGSLMPELRQKINAMNLQEEVKLNGFITNSKSFIADADIFVLPSKWEGFGYVLAEAMALSKPIVAFNISSNPELVQHNHTGLLAENENIEELANFILDLMKDSEKRELFGKNGRKKLEQEFSIDVAHEQLIEYLELKKEQ